MYQPETYGVALLLLIVSMLCWGSWANTVKMCPSYRFQLFYWDYVIGLILGIVIWGFTLGNYGSFGRHFLSDIAHASQMSMLLSIIGGVIFNLANLLLVAAIEIAGLAVAFPIGIGLALIIGAVSSYLIAPTGNPLLLFGGIALVVGAILLDAHAYRLRESERRAMSKRGLVITLIAGVLMGCFYPFVSRSMTTANGLGPYGAVFFFVVGVAICSIPANYMLMRKPLDGRKSASLSEYWDTSPTWHAWGVLGGMIWCTGATANFVASQTHLVGPAVSYSIGQGATMISACWGVFCWHEFANTQRRAKYALAWMFVLFLCGLGLIAVSPLFA